MKGIIYLLIFLETFFNLALAQVIKIESLASGFAYPVGIHNSGLPNDDRLFIIEKRGRIKIVNRLTGVINATPFLDIYSRVYPVSSQGDERGLLGMAFHPDYASNGYFFVHYVANNGKTIVARYQVSPFADTAFKYSEQILFNIHDPYSNHNGGNLMFGPNDGYLYISLGDGGSGGDPGNRAQNKDSLLGKMLRVDVNNPSPPYYFSAPGNPFYGATAGRDEIFDWGLRNAWRCSFDRVTGDLWMGDVGQNAVEEINFRSACDTIGHNYGWRCYEGNTAYNTSGCQSQSSYEAPVFVYSHTLGCSVTGGYVYRGALEGGLFGKYLFTDYCQGRIWATVPNGSGGWTTSQLTQSTTQINYNFSSFGEDIYGELYLAGIASGHIYRIRDTACAPVAFINAPDTMFVCGGAPVTFTALNGAGLTYNWSVMSGGTWNIQSGQGTNILIATSDVNSTATVMVTVSNGTCSSVSKKIVVFAGVKLNGLIPWLCVTSPFTTLTGSPAGGTFSGPGISGNTFNPFVAGAGIHTIHYSLPDTATTCDEKASGCILTTTRSVEVYYCDAINELSHLRDLKVYPNPGSLVFIVEFYSPESEIEITLNDALGRNIIYNKIEDTSGHHRAEIKIPDAVEGLYFLSIKAGHQTHVEKIFVVR